LETFSQPFHIVDGLNETSLFKKKSLMWFFSVPASVEKKHLPTRKWNKMTHKKRKKKAKQLLKKPKQKQFLKKIRKEKKKISIKKKEHEIVTAEKQKQKNEPLRRLKNW
jgi:hypothetical protein